MPIDFANANWTAILLASVLYFVLGGLWFSPVAFQKQWDRGIGFDRPRAWKPGPQYFVVPFLGCFTISLATALVLRAANARSLMDATILGLLVGAGYVGASTAMLAVTPTTPRPALLSAVVGIYHVVGILMISLVIFALR